MQRKTLSEQLEAYEFALKDCGLSYSSRLYAMRDAMSLIRRHKEVGAKYLDEQIISDFIDKTYERFYNGEIDNMGHHSLNETAYYIHILPENLTKSSAVDWGKFNAMFPEVRA
jgi:hypothetical protein